MSWVNGREAQHEDVMFTDSTDRGGTLSGRRAIETAGDRGYYSAPAISPERHRRLSRLQRLHNAVPDDRGRPTRRWSGWCSTPTSSGGATGAFTSCIAALRRRPRLTPERPGRGVPRRLRLRGGDPHLRRGRLERRPQRRRLRGHRRLPPGAARGGRGHRRADRGGRGAARRGASSASNGRRGADVGARPCSRSARRPSATPTSTAGPAGPTRSPRAADAKAAGTLPGRRPRHT